MPMHKISLVILLIVSGLFAGCAGWGANFDMPRIDLAGLEPVDKQTSGMPRFLVRVRVVNPNSVDLNIEGLYYELRIEGHSLFNGASNASTVIPGYGEGIVALETSPSLLGAIGLFKDLITRIEHQEKIQYALHTKISLGKYLSPLRLDHKGELDLSSKGARAVPPGI